VDRGKKAGKEDRSDPLIEGIFRDCEIDDHARL
jgi:hypothetical protein